MKFPNKEDVHVLLPDFADSSTRTEQEVITHNSGKREHIEDIVHTVANLGFNAILHLVKHDNYHQIIDQIAEGEKILNLCDGSDIDGTCGPSVAKYLESNKMNCPSFGCSFSFNSNTTTKEGMKGLFEIHAVSTPPGIAVGKSDLPYLREHLSSKNLTYPLFVKVSDSYGSVGISDESVCHTEDAAIYHITKMLLEFEVLIVEEFIQGPEFSVVVVGDASQPDRIVVYSAERFFLGNLPPDQQFLSFDRVWGGEHLKFYEYRSVCNQNDLIALEQLARQAYISVGGNCYGRVDIRKRKETNQLFVLEVNAACTIGKSSTLDEILRLSGLSTEDLLYFTLRPGQVSARKTVPVPKTGNTGFLWETKTCTMQEV